MRIKYLAINLSNEVKKKRSQVHGFELNIIKISTLSKAICIFNASPIKIPMPKIEKNSPKIHVEPQRTQNSQIILRNQNKDGGFILSDFKTYDKDTVIKIVWNWHKNSHINHWNRTEGPEIHPYMVKRFFFSWLPVLFHSLFDNVSFWVYKVKQHITPLLQKLTV